MQSLGRAIAFWRLLCRLFSLDGPLNLGFLTPARVGSPSVLGAWLDGRRCLAEMVLLYFLADIVDCTPCFATSTSSVFYLSPLYISSLLCLHFGGFASRSSRFSCSSPRCTSTSTSSRLTPASFRTCCRGFLALNVDLFRGVPFDIML